MKKTVVWILMTLLALAISFTIISVSHHERERGPSKTEATSKDTVTVSKVVKYPYPVVTDSLIVRHDTIRIKAPVPVADTITDTIYTSIPIPIVQKEYKDSLYHAWVSGYHPSLDSIHITHVNTYITNDTVRYVKEKKKRWGVGAQFGYGFTSDKPGPYIGIGISYNILTW